MRLFQKFAFVAALAFSMTTNPVESLLVGKMAVPTVVAGENCNPDCPEPGKASGKWKSTKAKERFEAECTWLPFPVGKVKKPVVFFTKESDSRCIGTQYRRSCPECTDWIHPSRPRGPVNGPAENAVIAVRLHNGLSGVSVPRDSIRRIKQDGAWCDYGTTPAHDSNHF